MRAMLAVLLAAVTSGSALAAATPDTWKPLYPFIGTWAGARSAGEGTEKIAREYESAVLDRNIKISERSDGKLEVRGLIRYDDDRGSLVLRRIEPDGSAHDMPLDAAASTDTRLVFASATGNPEKMRVSYERLGWNEFVERVERVADGQAPELISEVRFRRK